MYLSHYEDPTIPEAVGLYERTNARYPLVLYHDQAVGVTHLYKLGVS